jgi:predicted Rossmann-fold nucleotide-binding protein
MKQVCVFCRSSTGLRPAYRIAPQLMGEVIARQGLNLVYGGGNVGLMGIIADATLAASGLVNMGESNNPESFSQVALQ